LAQGNSVSTGSRHVQGAKSANSNLPVATGRCMEVATPNYVRYRPNSPMLANDLA